MYDMVDTLDQEVAMLQWDGWDVAKLEKLDDTNHDETFVRLTEEEWQRWLDLVDAAPELLGACRALLEGRSDALDLAKLAIDRFERYKIFHFV